MEVETITAFRKSLRKRIIVSDELLVCSDIDMEVRCDVITEQMCVDLILLLRGCKVNEQIVEERMIPKTWYDAFKKRWFPKWLRRYSPVTEERLVLRSEHWHVCPHIYTARYTARSENEEHIHFLSGRN